MHRLALGLEYTGTAYSGWQRQLHQTELLSVQSEVESAISKVANHQISTVCAGRTDAGVHASLQVLHCDVDADRSEYSWISGCNTLLPRDIRVLWAKTVPMSFDARRSATERRYIYVIYNNISRPALFYDYVAWYYRYLDANLMHQAAQSWLGTNDFTSFRGAGCQSVSPIRDLHAITVTRRASFVIIEVRANAFLYHMVRNLVGVLLEIGSGRKSVEWSLEVLAAKDRRKAGVTAPAGGLYLAGVVYPRDFGIPVEGSGLWFFNQGEG